MGHKHQAINALRIKRLLENEEITLELLAAAFGVTRESVNKWLRADAAPLWTELACEAIEKRLGLRQTQVILCEFPRKHTEMLVKFVKALGGRINTSFTTE